MTGIKHVFSLTCLKPQIRLSVAFRASLASSVLFIGIHSSGGNRLCPHSVVVKTHVVSKQGRFLELYLGKGKRCRYRVLRVGLCLE